VGVTTRADCGQSTLALVVPPFFLSCLSCRFPFVLVLPRDSLGNGLRGFGAAVDVLAASHDGCAEALMLAHGFRRTFFQPGSSTRNP
jgi:hypothetical protein